MSGVREEGATSSHAKFEPHRQPTPSFLVPVRYKTLLCASYLTMAPTKKDPEKGERESKLSLEKSAALVLDYLRKQNRPYSAVDVSTNLKNRVSKATAAKLLKDMHERNEIEGRAAGKQIVYHAIQVRSMNTPLY